MKVTIIQKIDNLKKLYKERVIPWLKAVIWDGKNIILEKNSFLMQAHLSPPKTRLKDQESEKYFKEIQTNKLSVIVWRNNSGKSFLLKNLKGKMWSSTHLIQVNRYQNFSLIQEFSPNENEKEQFHSSFMDAIQQPQNSENVLVWLPQAFWKLHEDKVKVLYKIIEDFFSITKVESKNIKEWYPFSQRYVDCDGINLAYMSSGFRLCIYLLAVLLDDTFDSILIDEPELGISPELQWKLAELLLNDENRKTYFPHIKHLILATHSSIFLDKQDIGNNYMIKKTGDNISINKTKDRIQFYDINSFLWNRFETLWLPSVIICVEWETDEKFLQKVMNLRFPDLRVSVLDSAHYENSKWWESKISWIIYLLNKFVWEFQDSPYRNRIFILVDSSFKEKDKEKIISKWLLDENFKILSQNGIEYYYPQEILDKIFKTKKYQVSFNTKGEIFFWDVVFSKKELNNKVVDLLSVDNEYPSEFEKFIKKFESL